MTREGTGERSEDRGNEGRGSVSAPAAWSVAAARRLGRFALVLNGDRMAPRIEHGALLVVDAHAVPAAGDVVIAELATPGGPPLSFRAGPVAMQVNADGDLVDCRGGYAAAGRWRLVGVVVEVVT